MVLVVWQCMLLRWVYRYRDGEGSRFEGQWHDDRKIRIQKARPGSTVFSAPLCTAYSIPRQPSRRLHRFRIVRRQAGPVTRRNEFWGMRRSRPARRADPPGLSGRFISSGTGLSGPSKAPTPSRRATLTPAGSDRNGTDDGVEAAARTEDVPRRSGVEAIAHRHVPP